MKVTWASMGGVVTATALPLRIGTIRPGSSQAITLIFRYLSAGPAAFKIDGTCSFGYFGTVQDVAAPQLHVPTRHETTGTRRSRSTVSSAQFL